MRLSFAANRLFGQPMFQILTKIKEMERTGKNIVHFEIGDPDFNTPENIINAGIKSLNAGRTHYASAVGDYELRKKICEINETVRGFKPDIDQVMISPGANILIYFMVQCLMNQGEEIILPDPCFSTYISVAKFCDVKLIFVPLKEQNGFRMQPKDILERITDKTRIILVNSPHNPTGAVMTNDELDEIYKICKEKDIYLISDEIYRWLNYENKNYSVSVNDKCKENVLVIDGFSKAYAMTGWRLGYTIAPEPIINKMQLLLETLCSCVPPFIQDAGIEALAGTQEPIKAMRDTYYKRRNLLIEGLNSIPKIQCNKPEGAFYVFPNITKTGISSTEFADRLLEEALVGVVPGEAFGEAGRGYIRLCYATDEKNIIEGIERIRRFVKKL